MKRMYTLMALGLVALLALSGIAMAKGHGRDDRPGDDHGRHGRHDLRDDNGHQGRHHRHHHDRFLPGTGTVSAFDLGTGKLTIALANGESVSGLVTQNTEINCEGIDQRRDHGGDDHGGRGNEPGDDKGGEAPVGAPGAECSTASLVAGATVGEAELRLEGGMAVWEEIELGRHS
jgi:hypothetical protein